VAGRRHPDGGRHARGQQIEVQSPLPLLQLELVAAVHDKDTGHLFRSAAETNSA
jgi:hypothetical protein